MLLNNDIGTLSGTPAPGSSGNLSVAPLFLGPGDYRLSGNSPLIDKGAASPPGGLSETDVEEDSRVIGSAPDIGAYEWFPVNPVEGTIGTEITISGSGFGTKKGKVLVGGVSLKILEWTDDSIRCQLTKALSPDTYAVTIQPQAKGSSSIMIANGLTVKAPEIGAVDPTGGSTGDEITVNGSFFGTKKRKVTLGGKTCKVLSWTMHSTTGEIMIQFIVPKGLRSGTQELKLTNAVGSDTMNFAIK